MKENANKNPINPHITDSEDIKLLENSELRESVLSKYLINYVKKLNVEAVKALLDEGANPDFFHSDKNEHYRNALHEAVNLGAIYKTEIKNEIIKELLSKGANPELCEYRKKDDKVETLDTPLSNAIKKLDFDSVKLLLKTGAANPNILTSDGKTPLMYAIQNIDTNNLQKPENIIKDKIIDLLLSQDNPIKTEVDISDSLDDPLTFAFEKNDNYLFDKLMEAGADPYKPRTLASNGETKNINSIYMDSKNTTISNKQNPIDQSYIDENSARGKILKEISEGKQPKLYGFLFFDGKVEWGNLKSNILDKLTEASKITGVKSIIESGEIQLDEEIKLFNLLTENEKVSIVKKLNSSINQDFYKYAMHDAVKLGSVELIKAIAEKSDVNNMIVGGINPLTSAVEKGYTDAIKALVNSGADIHWKNKDGSTAVSIANNNPSKLIALYSKNPEVLIQKKIEEAKTRNSEPDYTYIREKLLKPLDETQKINAIVNTVNNTLKENHLKELTTNLSNEEKQKIKSILQNMPAKNIRRDGVNNLDELLNKNSLNPFERIIPADLINHNNMFKKYESYDKSYTDVDKLYSAFDVAMMGGDNNKIDEYLTSIENLSIVGKKSDDLPIYRENLSHHLLLSILSNNQKAVDALIKAGAYTDHFYYSNANDTPLGVAIKEGHPDIIKTLIKAGAKVQEYHIKLAKEIDNNNGDMKTTAALYQPSEIILNTVNKAKGFFYDSEKGWKDVNKLVNSLTKEEVLAGAMDVFKNTTVSNDRKRRLFNLLDEDSQNRIIEQANTKVAADKYSRPEKDTVTYNAILNIADNDPKLLAKIYADKPEELLTNKMQEIEKKYIQDSKSFMSTFFKPVKNYEVVKGILEALGDKAKPAVSNVKTKDKEKLSSLLKDITQDVKPTNKIDNNSHINDVLNKTQSTVNTLSTSSTITNKTDTLTNKPNNTTKKNVTFAPDVLENAQKQSVEETKKGNSRASTQIV